MPTKGFDSFRPACADTKPELAPIRRSSPEHDRLISTRAALDLEPFDAEPALPFRDVCDSAVRGRPCVLEPSDLLLVLKYKSLLICKMLPNRLLTSITQTCEALIFLAKQSFKTKGAF